MLLPGSSDNPTPTRYQKRGSARFNGESVAESAVHSWNRKPCRFLSHHRCRKLRQFKVMALNQVSGAITDELVEALLNLAQLAWINVQRRRGVHGR